MHFGFDVDLLRNFSLNLFFNVNISSTFYFSFPLFSLCFPFFLNVNENLAVNSYGMDDGQMNHMNPMSGIQLSDNIDFNLDSIDMYTSSFN